MQAVIRAKGNTPFQKPEGLFKKLLVTDQHKNRKNKNHILNDNLASFTLCLCKENRYKQGMSINTSTNSTKYITPRRVTGLFSTITLFDNRKQL
jgi:hypothetical protein